MNLEQTNAHDLFVVPLINVAALMLGLTEVHQLVSIAAALVACIYTVIKTIQLIRDLSK